MFEKFEYSKLFRDYLYQYIKIDYKIIYQLIETKEFQRLSRISQLGGVQVVFHTANHTRFEHSLGAYELARRVSSEVNDIRNRFSEREVLLFLISALLHDIGHGPFSHTFEPIFKINHEKMTVNIIKGESEVNHVLKRCDDKIVDDICSILMKEGKFPIIESLVSSQIDVDRLDYLMRDAYSLGLVYGKVDVNKLFMSMRLKHDKIHFKDSALFTVEDYLSARQSMYWQVYLHPKSRAFDIMIEKFIKRIRDLLLKDFKFRCDISLIREYLFDPESPELFNRLDDYYFRYLMNVCVDEKDGILSDLAYRLRNRKLFKHTNNTSVKYEDRYTYVRKIGLDTDYYLEVDSVENMLYRTKALSTDTDTITMISRTNAIYKLDVLSKSIRSLTEIRMSDELIFYGEVYD